MHIRLHGAAMSLTAMASGFVVLVLSVSVVQGQDGWGVTYTSAQICAFKGSTVDIHCTYTYPPRINGLDTTIERTFWFTKGSNKEPVDLRTDSDYTGRVQYHCAENSCTLTITDLRESDSAVYKFRFIANQDGGRFTGSPGVTVSVTGLQVIASKISKYSFWADLKCHSSCHPPNFPSYIWYRNGQNTGRTGSYSDHIKNEDSISCAFKGHEDFPSPSVCVRGQSCNRVTYTDRNICAFKGSSVDISCTYNGYYHVESKVWFSPGRSLSWRNPKEPEDLREDSEYSGRVEVLQTVRGRSTLRITDLRESDSAEYRFKFKTQWFEWRSSLPGTTLTVRDPDVQVQVIWTSSGVKLICHSSCLLPGRSAFDWFRNEIKIQGETSPTFRGNVDPADSYSCAYEGHRAFPVCEFTPN
uniref:Ig-like domain-containing protein n=1 Tax=Lates calcarifer TaxID=8187 RepID=A0A4W6EH80_LATCA